MNGLIMPGYLIVAVLIGLLAIPNRIGFFGGFLLSLLATPLGALIVMVAVQFMWPRKDRAFDDDEN